MALKQNWRKSSEFFWCANELNQALRPEMIVMVTRHRSVFKV